jgi:hypothetical protein
VGSGEKGVEAIAADHRQLVEYKSGSGLPVSEFCASRLAFLIVVFIEIRNF